MLPMFSSSLELCAISPSNGQFASLTVCKMQALRCMGKNIQIVEDSNCKWPQHNRSSCTECHMWENCDGRKMEGHKHLIALYSVFDIFINYSFFSYYILPDQSNQCRCKDSADCSTPGLNVCVRVGEDLNVAPQTMSECDAGIRRCKGEKVMVVSILPCAS